MSIYANSGELSTLSKSLGVETEVYEAALFALMEAQATLCVKALIDKYPHTSLNAPEADDGIGGILVRFSGEGAAPEELQECDGDGEL